MKVSIARKIRAHLWTLPRFFAAPFFGSMLLLGSVIAGGWNTANSWWALVAGLCIMAGGHSFNSFLDYAWTGLDKGVKEDRSAEKDYTGGQNLIENGVVTPGEICFNALAYYLIAAIILFFLIPGVHIWLYLWGILAMLDTFWYSKSKFNWTHELALAFGAGPGAVMIGMYAVTPSPNVLRGLLVTIPVCMIFSFAGLALDEWPDAEANLKKGVKSLAYMVWQYSPWTLEVVNGENTYVRDINTLRWYLSYWFVSAYVFQLALIVVGYLDAATLVTFLLLPIFAACFVFLGKDFRKAAGVLVAVAALYPVLLLAAQAF